MSVKTLNQLLDHCIARYPRNDVFQHKEGGAYASVSTADFAHRVRSFALGLVDLGVRRGDPVALLSENRLEWAVADLAILSVGGITVPVYSTLPPLQILHILKDSAVKIIIISNQVQLEKVRAISSQLPEGFTIILIESTERLDEACFRFADLSERGRALSNQYLSLFPNLSREISPGDTATIVYTSGTSGTPKGVMLTHQNILTNVRAVLERIPLGPQDGVLSFLPLSHILERMAGFYTILYAGGTIAYAGSLDTIAEDIRAIRPTLMITVPRFLEKMYENIRETVASGPAIGRFIFRWSLERGQRRPAIGEVGKENRRAESLASRLASRFVYSRLREKLGGQIRFFISGGAPLSPDIARFYHAVGLPVYEGYGLTETSPVVSVNAPGAWKIGSVGRPVPGVEVITAADGEILVRGPNVMAGYLGRAEETAEAIAGGWFHTGDIGRIDADGYLYITDRKKDLIVTSGGRNIAPQPIETLLKSSPYIKEAVLIGNRRPFISALICPDFDRFTDAAREAGIDPGAREVLANLPEVQEIIAREIEERSRDLAKHEQVKVFQLMSRDFEIDSGELTPTLKVKRRVIEERNKELIDRMYR